VGAPRRLTRDPDGLLGVAARVEELLIAAGETEPLAVAMRLVRALAAGTEVEGEGVVAECARLLAPHARRDGNLAVADALFEVTTSRRARADKGQFFTPRHVVELMVRLVAPRDGEVVLDPAAGSGAFLWHAAARADVRVIGVEIDPRAADVARALLGLLDRGETGKITVGDGLRARLPRADVVLTNPPFAGEIVDAALLATFEVAHGKRRVERDALFVERAVSALRPGGRLAIVLPHRLVSDASLAPVRRFLLERCIVRAVIGLEPSTFMPHTQQRAAIVVAERRGPRTKSLHPEIAFAISRRPGVSPRGVPIPRRDAPDAWRALDHDLDEVLTALEAGDRTRVAYRAPADLDEHATLAPQRWAIESAPSDQLTLGDVAILAPATIRPGSRGYVVDTSDLDAGVVRSDVLGRGLADAGSQKRQLLPGDVAISRLRPYLRQIAFVDDDLPGPLLASTEILALRPRTPGDDLAYVTAYLLSEGPQRVLGASVEGGHHPRFRPESLLGLPLPRAVFDARARISRDLRAAIALRRTSDRALARVL
jgi:type I restriction enzyme M protein